MTELHPSHLWSSLQNRLRSQVSSWLLILTLWSAIGLGATVKDYRHRPLFFALGLLAGFAAMPIRQMAIDADRKASDTADVSTQAYQNWLMQAMAPTAATVRIEAPPLPPALFDWSDLVREPDLYPHLFLLGKTGAGKTWLAERLVTYLGGHPVVITPHRKPTDFHGFPVIGAGRNYSVINEAFEHLEGEMQTRYQRYAVGDESYQMVNVIIDEFPSIAANCKGVVPIAKTLIREARKVRIRLIILSQGDEVKTLGIEGEGSLRNSLTFIRLRGFVETYAKSLKDEQVFTFLKQFPYPCMVEDTIANSAELLMLPSSVSTYEANSETVVSEPFQAETKRFTRNETFQDRFTVKQRETGVFHDSETFHAGVSDPVSDPDETDETDETLKRIQEMLNLKMNQKQIIYALWKVKPGGTDKYRKAVDKYKRLLSQLDND